MLHQAGVIEFCFCASGLDDLLRDHIHQCAEVGRPIILTVAASKVLVWCGGGTAELRSGAQTGLDAP
jgi:hypothetical protein